MRTRTNGFSAVVTGLLLGACEVLGRCCDWYWQLVSSGVLLYDLEREKCF